MTFMPEEAGDLGLKIGPLEGVPGGACLKLSGKGGRAAVRRLEEAIQPLLERGTRRLLFDCGALEFFNSTALGYLIHLADHLRAAGGALAFSRVPKKVRMAFDLLGLQEFFRFFPDDQAAATYLFQGPPPEPAEERMEILADEDEPAPEPKETAGAPTALLAALPSWLDEVDQPKQLPLDHPRWTILVKTLFERLGTGSLQELCRRKGVSAAGPVAEVVRRILRSLGSPQEILDPFDEKTLGELVRIFRLSAGSGKAARVKAIVAFVESSTTEAMSEFLRADRELAPPEAPVVPVEPTAAAVREALESCPFPKLLRSERAAREIVEKRLANVFGEGAVASGRTLGSGSMTPADLEVAGRFGIVVRQARPLLGSKKSATEHVETLLGRLVILGGVYGRGDLFLLVWGEVPQGEREGFHAFRGWAEGIGVSVAHVG
jgi:anti-anti-sigma factor